MTEYDENWIATYTGLKFHYLDPSPDEIRIEDIAHALSLKCRFLGHCRLFYSVAEHSYRVAERLPDELKLSGLLHDAAEAYLPDIPRPIKVHYGLKEAEDKIFTVIAQKYELKDSRLIKEADDVLLATEARDLLPNMDGWARLPEPLPARIKPLSAATAETLFLREFKLWRDYD